MSYLIIL